MALDGCHRHALAVGVLCDGVYHLVERVRFAGGFGGLLCFVDHWISCRHTTVLSSHQTYAGSVVFAFEPTVDR